MAGKFEVFEGKNVGFYFRLKAGNGETILQSQKYSAKAGCLNGVQSVRENAPNDVRYDRKIAQNGQHFFNLLAGNGQIIGTSETYTTKSAMENGISSVKKNAPDATLVDLTDKK